MCKEYLGRTGKQYFENLQSSSPSQTRLFPANTYVHLAPCWTHPSLHSPHKQPRKAQDNAEHKVRGSTLPSRGCFRRAPETNWTSSRNPAPWRHLAPASQPSETPASTETVKLVLED